MWCPCAAQDSIKNDQFRGHTRRENEVSTRIRRLEVPGSSRHVRVARDHPHKGPIETGRFDEPVQCRRNRVAKNLFQVADRFDRRLERASLFREAISKKQQPPRAKICFRFDRLLAYRDQRQGIVPEHHIVVPWQEAVADLMRLVPAMLQFRQCRIEHYPFSIRKIERLDRGFADCFEEQHRPLEYLQARDAHSANRLP